MTALSSWPASLTLLIPSDEPPRAGLDEHRQPQAVQPRHGAVAATPPVHVGDDLVVPHRQTSRGKQNFHDVLVHHRSGGHHATPDVGDVGHLEEALNGPVLTEGSVQDGEDDIDFAEGSRDLTGALNGQRPVTAERQYDATTGLGHTG